MTYLPEVRLDRSDPFEAALIEMVKVFRSKNGDYAGDNGIFYNFEATAALMGLRREQVADAFEVTKMTRIKSLGGGDVNNESVLDSYLDKANYAVIAYAMKLEESWRGSPPLS